MTANTMPSPTCSSGGMSSGWRTFHRLRILLANIAAWYSCAQRTRSNGSKPHNSAGTAKTSVTPNLALFADDCSCLHCSINNSTQSRIRPSSHTAQMAANGLHLKMLLQMAGCWVAPFHLTTKPTSPPPTALTTALLFCCAQRMGLHGKSMPPFKQATAPMKPPCNCFPTG